ncbi:MAG: carbohydrate ABC transporter permease [Clostridia bacterium]|nr:carbohydrate ABC transporter permease [Clostridia bacterium]
MKRFENKQTGILSSSDLKTPYGKVLYWAFFAILALVALIALIPGIWTIMTAFKDTQEIYSAFGFFPKDMSWGRMVSRVSESWNALQLGDSFINTIVMSLGSLAMHVVVCGFGGYVLSKLKPTGSKFIFVLVVWTMMMPSQIRMVPNYISWLHFPFAGDTDMGVNLLDTFWPMWLGAGADTFAVLLFKNAFDGLSDSYVEAAKLDGCSNYGVFFRIMLPLAMPVIIFQSINVLSGAWSDFFTPLLVLDKNAVVPLKIYRLQADTSVQMNTYFMALVFASIPPFIIFAVFQKQILGGINIGGVKG